MRPWLTVVRRVGMTLAYRTISLVTRIAGTGSVGVKALVVTPSGRIVLVRHSYMAGWHFPGGGLKRDETPEQGIIRELREEIGLHCWASIDQSDEPTDRADPNCTGPALFIFTDADYRFRSNLEIEAASEFAPEALPGDCSPSVRRHVAWWQAGKALTL
jgi:8-oxo-dGTP pyrophosphatase MutT (NUDIX family)